LQENIFKNSDGEQLLSSIRNFGVSQFVLKKVSGSKVASRKMSL